MLILFFACHMVLRAISLMDAQLCIYGYSVATSGAVSVISTLCRKCWVTTNTAATNRLIVTNRKLDGGSFGCNWIGLYCQQPESGLLSLLLCDIKGEAIGNSAASTIHMGSSSPKRFRTQLCTIRETWLIPFKNSAILV